MLCYSKENDILNLSDKNIAIIIPVNCKGVMGAGLAKQFADKYPELLSIYKQSCIDNSLSIGHCTLEVTNYGKFIFFPTKDNWQNPSKLEYIESGMDSICRMLDHFTDLKIAIPPIGCGLGGLDRADVLSIIYEKTKSYKNLIFLTGW